MRKVALLSDKDRGELFIATSALVGIRPEAVEKDFDMLRLKKPATINVKVRGIAGIMNGVIVKRNIDIVRNNK